jgi:ATP phosphoribosyltransferase regulatory subunit HisZ
MPTPSGTRDVLPDEMRELRAITRAMVDRLDAAGYGEVRTPTLEYERSLPGRNGSGAAYRLIDEHGETLVLRSDMTLPIARIAATRYSDVSGPLRFCYLSRAWRRVKPRSGEAREVLQLGAELIGGGADGGASELLNLLGEVLDASGLKGWKLAVGDSRIVGELLDASGVSGDERVLLVDAAKRGDFVAVKRHAASADSVGGRSLNDLLALRSSVEALSAEVAASTKSLTELQVLAAGLPAELRDRIIIDLSLSPDLGYYEGLVFEVYDSAIGRPLGGGGRYDPLMKECGKVTEAIGFALDADLVHAALAGEERGERSAS